MNPSEKPLNSYIMVHHYCSEEHLFQTITMYNQDEREAVFQDIINNKSWYWGRFAPGHRKSYMRRRIMVETRMVEEFSQKYWKPKDTCPVYFYIYPRFSLQTINDQLTHRLERDEPNTKYLLVDLRDLESKNDISFTISDSMTSYREVLKKEIEVYSEPSAIPKHADHGTIFHIDEIDSLISKYSDDDDLYFEVQVWDKNILNTWKKKREL